ncbi:MAG: type II secretion system F family protein [Janthinobacterium lividum]
MARFRYTAIEPSGQTARGEMDAVDEAEVVRRLQREGKLPLRAEPAEASVFAGLLAQGAQRGLRRGETAEVVRELSVMLATGQDLDRALRFLAETAPNPRVAGVVGRLRDAVRDGGALAAAMANEGRSFPPLLIGLVRAGEAGGTLAATLDHLAGLLERERKLAATIKTALVYPALLLVAAIGAIVLLLTTVLPQFVPLFEQSGAALPASTRFLIDAGDALGRYGLFALAGLGVLALMAAQALRRPAVRLRVDRLALRVPVFGNLAREALAARFSRTLGTLLLNGVALLPALRIVPDAVGNLAAAQAVEQAALGARSGGGLSRPLAESGIFPARMLHLLRLGEETAQLGRMAIHAAEIHEERTRQATQRMVALLVPAITVVMGAAVAGIVSSLLLAMLSLNDLAQ